MTFIIHSKNNKNGQVVDKNLTVFPLSDLTYMIFCSRGFSKHSTYYGNLI